jgi:hypothetical protein
LVLNVAHDLILPHACARELIGDSLCIGMRGMSLAVLEVTALRVEPELPRCLPYDFLSHHPDSTKSIAMTDNGTVQAQSLQKKAPRDSLHLEGLRLIAVT